MKDFQERVVVELVELTKKYEALESFMNDQEKYRALSSAEAARMRDQQSAMYEYKKILHQRVAHFEL